jgi:hypothetical protein
MVISLPQFVQRYVPADTSLPAGIGSAMVVASRSVTPCHARDGSARNVVPVGRLRAANARERKAGLRLDHRSSARLVEAAERLGEMLRSDNLESAMWADEVIKRHILPETSKHTSGLAGWYKPEPEN